LCEGGSAVGVLPKVALEEASVLLVAGDCSEPEVRRHHRQWTVVGVCEVEAEQILRAQVDHL
jgi:hypothetical protein